MCSTCDEGYLRVWTGVPECSSCDELESHTPSFSLIGSVVLLCSAVAIGVYKMKRTRKFAEQLYRIGKVKLKILFFTSQVAFISFYFSTRAFLTFRPSVRPSVHPPVRPSASPSIRPSVRPAVRPSARPSVRPSVRPFTCLRPSVRPSARPTVGPSVRPSGRPAVRPSVRPTVLRAWWCGAFPAVGPAV